MIKIPLSYRQNETPILIRIREGCAVSEQFAIAVWDEDHTNWWTTDQRGVPDEHIEQWWPLPPSMIEMQRIAAETPRT